MKIKNVTGSYGYLSLSKRSVYVGEFEDGGYYAINVMGGVVSVFKEDPTYLYKQIDLMDGDAFINELNKIETFHFYKEDNPEKYEYFEDYINKEVR